MTRRTPTALAVLLLLPAALIRADAPKGDKDLDGEWEVVSFVADGTGLAAPPGGYLVMTIKGDALATKDGNDTRTGAIKIDAFNTPKTINVTPAVGPDKGKIYQGVYEVKGDELRLCIAEAGKGRPTEFSSKEGSGWTLGTFKRVKK